MDDCVLLSLKHDLALVLFNRLARIRASGQPADLAPQAEQRVLWDLELVREEHQLMGHFGDEKARDLLPIMRWLENEFFESDAEFTVSDLTETGDRAASRFRELHPELTQDAIEVLAWCYSYDFK